MKSIQSNIINNKIYFKFEDKNKQGIYNYCTGFCFNWADMEKYIDKQLKQYKKKDIKYYEFIFMVKEYISNKDIYNQLKEDIELKFWECKNKYKLPQKKEFQILCNTFQTIDVDIKEFQWVFSINNNDRIGGSERRGVYDKLIIPVKYSDYHKQKLEGKKLANTFNLKLNRYGRIEIIGCYDVDIKYPQNEPTCIVGIDIGLKQLITCSDGEIIDQNEQIIKRLKRATKQKGNRLRLEKHLQNKYNDVNYKINNKRYLLQEARISNYIKSDNRYKIKQFLKGREHEHIIMEDLHIGYSTHSKEVNYLLKRMGIQRIKDDVLKYAKEQGTKVSLVNSAFTSQTCPKCGYISKENRKTQEMFCCVKCGFTDNADHNASINIMNRHYENRINLNTPYWRVKEILNVDT